MVKSYCVKQKKQTECIQGSEKYVKAKNGRLMMKCKCAECGITKTRFIKQTSGRGVGETINKKIGNKIPGFQHWLKILLLQSWVSQEVIRSFLINTGVETSQKAPSTRKPDYFQRNSGHTLKIRLVHAIALCSKMENGITNIVINI